MVKPSRFLALGALCLAAHGVLAGEPSQAADEDAAAAVSDMAAIQSEVVTLDRIAGEFEVLAGSHKNAQNLVIGLRNAKPVKMTEPNPPPQEVTFTPPTRPMSFADVHKALALAQAQLQAKRIDKPTPSHLKASLAGGELPNASGEMTRVIGILPLHRRGMSWEQIARALRVAAPKRVAAAAAGTGEL